MSRQLVTYGVAPLSPQPPGHPHLRGSRQNGEQAKSKPETPVGQGWTALAYGLMSLSVYLSGGGEMGRGTSCWLKRIPKSSFWGGGIYLHGPRVLLTRRNNGFTFQCFCFSSFCGNFYVLPVYQFKPWVAVGRYVPERRVPHRIKVLLALAFISKLSFGKCVEC